MQDDAPPLLDAELPTFADLLLAAERAFPGQEAFVEGSNRITYGEWVDQSLRVASAFAERGVEPGAIVLIALENGVDYAVCFAAAQLLGGIASGVNLRLGRREFDGIIERSGAALIIVEDDAPEPKAGPRVVRRSELAKLRQAPTRAAPHAGRPDDAAVIIWTSGTTGMPKGACFTHDNLRNAVRTAGPVAAPLARKLSSVPFAHAGFMSKGWEQVAFGMTLVVAPTPWSADAMLRILVDERINIAGAVPTQWTKLLAHPGLGSADLSHITVGITATAPAPPELVEQVSRAIGAPLIVRYSMTECPSMTGTRIGDSADVQYRTVGRPQVGVELKFLDDDRSEVPAGAVGRIAVRSKALTVGYWNDPEKTAEALIGDGWMLTGDFGRLDDSGNVILAGRANEMYIRGGYNIYPIEVERIIGEMPDVASVAVVGTPAPTIGEIGVAFVVPMDPANPPSLEAVRSKVRSELADYKAPDQIVLIDALPVTPMMKVDKQALKVRAAALETTRG
ncbi:long-chain fatty acid--CoA ligase [Sphingomonas sp. TF3]|uniref:class I adenylate-forming enzyme family protein n=1 Tax=Sphingomonas sp. TF3 TaxID=2495580 RepID=UPI000F895D55|nr:class I adenylate-forming enzyme family protein [Sphingomonas sp. TF3]RUN78359.1 long-chain fatty acid--CoA ligase [Sphingomonas sp. TF3]